MSTKNTVSVVSEDANWSNSLKGAFKSAGLNLLSYATVDEFMDEFDPAKPVGAIVAKLSDGLELIREVAKSHCMVPVVLQADGGGVTAVVQVMKAGAYDVVEKADALAESAKKAASFAARNQSYIEEKALASERIESLTRRETQVLNLMVQGIPNREIAEELGISSKTLDIHRANLMDKMEARTSADMCRAFLVNKTNIFWLPHLFG